MNKQATVLGRSADSKCLVRLLRSFLLAVLDLPTAADRSKAEVSQADDDTHAGVLAQFHAAEYASERNSVDVWKTLQYALVPIMFVAWSLLAEIRGTIPDVLFWWASAAVLPISYVAYQKAMVDALTGVLSIEEHVRPRAIMLAGTDEFWFHEPVYRKQVKPDAAYGWYWPPLLSFVSPLAVLTYRAVSAEAFANSYWWRYPAGVGEIAGFVLCVCAAVFVGHLSKQGLALNRQIGEQIRGRELSWLKED